MKEQFTLVTVPMNWHNPHKEIIVGIGLPSKTAKELGIGFFDNDNAKVIRDLFEGATGSDHAASILTVDALLELEMGNVSIVAGAVFKEENLLGAKIATIGAINALNLLNFGPTQE